MNAGLYIFACIGCGRLHESNRKDRLTCSGQCRVRAHRNGSLKALRDLARRCDVKPGGILRAQALCDLRPDLAELVRTGERSLDTTDRDVRAAFFKRLMQVATQREAAP